MREGKNIFLNYYKVIQLLWKVSWKDIILIIGLTIITGVIPTFSTLIMQRIVNLIQSPKKQIQSLALLVSFYIMCDLISSLIGNLLNYISVIFQQKLTLEIDMKILQKVETLGLQDFEYSESYNKLQRAQAQGGVQVFSYFSYITSIVKYVVMVLGSALILLAWNKWSIVLVSITAFINAILLLRINKYQYEILRKRTGESREKWYYQYILTNDIAYKEIKIYGLHKYFINKFKMLANKFLFQDKDIAKKNVNIGTVRVILEQIGDAIILGNIFRDTFFGKILIGDTIAYIRSVSNIKSNINGLFMQTVSIFKESLYISQLFEFLEMPTRGDNNLEKKKIDAIGLINIYDLSYKYKNTDHYVLKNINMTINNRDNLVIVGKNGSGKSTLVKILAGFYDDYEGEIFINGVNLREIDKETYRDKIGILFQDYNRYELNVRENVCVGNLDSLYDDDKIKTALNYASAPSKLCENLDKQLGFWFNNGYQLSGGEWLRIGISRVFLRSAELYILDEPNAALDPIGEESIMDSFRNLVSNKIGIIITHRIGNIERLPGEIIVMDEGEIIDKGNHNELLGRCAIYEEMYTKST